MQPALHLYGSSRHGIYNVNLDVQNCSTITGSNIIFTRGNKFFQLANHLGNNLAVISDRKLPVSLDGIFLRIICLRWLGSKEQPYIFTQPLLEKNQQVENLKSSLQQQTIAANKYLVHQTLADRIPLEPL